MGGYALEEGFIDFQAARPSPHPLAHFNLFTDVNAFAHAEPVADQQAQQFLPVDQAHRSDEDTGRVRRGSLLADHLGEGGRGHQ